MAYEIKYRDEAIDDLEGIPAFDRVAIIDAIEKQLSHQPTVETRRRHPIKPEGAFASFEATWSLRVDDYRVYYDVQPETLVIVISVIFKGTMAAEEALAKHLAKKQPAEGGDES